MKIPLITYKADFIKNKNESMEMWARRIRHNYYEFARKKFKCDYIFTGHHLNDKVETIIMNIDNGCSIEGLRGIPKKNKFIIRPLINIKRKEIESYICRNKLPFVEDLSNYDILIKRNLVRKRLIKPWEEQSIDVLSKFNKLSIKAESVIKKMNLFIKELSKRFNVQDNFIEINDNKINFLSLNHKVRLIKYLIGNKKISWRYNRWKSLEQWITNAKIGSKFKINPNWELLRDRSKFILKKYVIGSDGFELVLNKVNDYDKSNNSFSEIIDGSTIEGKRIKLRKWKSGDYFQPLGMIGRKKISDFLIDEKIDLFTKQKQMVVTANNKIIWVCGHRLSDSVKVNDNTSKFMELSLVPELKD